MTREGVRVSCHLLVNCMVIGFGGQSVGNCRELWVEGGAAGRIN